MTEELNELIRDLPEGTTVGTIDSSNATIGDHEFSEAECRKVFDSEDTVDQLIEAMGGIDVTEKKNVELVGLEIDDAVLDRLESNFKSIDDA